MPRELWVVSPEKTEYREYELPSPKPGQILVRTDFAVAKHGTELAFIKGYGNRVLNYDDEWQLFRNENGSVDGYPVAAGNMFVGVATETGSGVDGLSAGDRVLGRGQFKEAHCVYADMCWKLPVGVSWKSAMCLDPAEFALGAVRDGNIRIGDSVAIFGMGAIGLMAVQLSKATGAYPVVAVEPCVNRAEAARACGADIVLDPLNCDLGMEIRKMTAKRGVDVAIELSGNMKALQSCLRSVAFGGNVVMAAFPQPFPPGLDLGKEAHFNTPNIVFSRACSNPSRDHPRWDEKRILDTCLRMIMEGQLDGEHVVSPVVGFDELGEQYLKVLTNPSLGIKLGVKY